MKHAENYNILIVAQAGRLQYEAVLFAASLRHTNPDLKAQLHVAEPQPGPLWPANPGIKPNVRALLEELGATIIPFENHYFGSRYPNGNKIEALKSLPKGEPFVFFDTDTLIHGDLSEVPFDFERPTASMLREDTWPKIELYGPGYAAIWRSLYEKFGLDFESSLDLRQPDEHWERYLYFNAGFFFGRCPHEFGELFLKFATEIETDPPKELECQVLDPWLDQIALPLVIHALGGGRDTLPAGFLDGKVSCHWRVLSLLYAREPDSVVELLETVCAPNKIKKVLKEHEPFKRMVFQERGAKVRALFDQNDLPVREQKIRNTIKKAKLWTR